jgi:hypothetical protein
VQICEFRGLPPPALSTSFGINKIYVRPVTLADIYNEEQVVEFETTEKRIGFVKN